MFFFSLRLTWYFGSIFQGNFMSSLEHFIVTPWNQGIIHVLWNGLHSSSLEVLSRTNLKLVKEVEVTDQFIYYSDSCLFFVAVVWVNWKVVQPKPLWLVLISCLGECIQITGCKEFLKTLFCHFHVIPILFIKSFHFEQFQIYTKVERII